MAVSEDEYPVPPRVVGRGAVFVEHRLKAPQVAESAYIAPTAVLAGDVAVGPHSRVMFGAVITAEGGAVVIVYSRNGSGQCRRMPRIPATRTT